MNTTYRVNVISAINSSKIKRVGNRIIVSGMVPIVDNVVMNGGLYPAEEIAKSYQTIADTPAPAGHPENGDGAYIPAGSADAMLNYYVGAWNRNVKYEGGKVSCDVEINVDQAMAMPKGKELVEKLEKAMNGETVEPINVSTGLLLNKEKKSGKDGGKEYSWIARNMEFDHVAILLDQQGAATPSDGVGMFVNAAGEKIEAETVVMNIESVANDKRGMLTRWVNAISGGMSFGEIAEGLQEVIEEKFGECRWVIDIYSDSVVFTDGEEFYRVAYETTGDMVKVGDLPEKVDRIVSYDVKKESVDMDAQKLAEQAMNAAKASGEELGKVAASIEALSSQVNALADVVKSLAADKDAALNAKREAVKSAFKLDDVAVNAMGAAAIESLYGQTKQAAPIAGGMTGNAADEFAGYNFPSLEG